MSNNGYISRVVSGIKAAAATGLVALVMAACDKQACNEPVVFEHDHNGDGKTDLVEFYGCDSTLKRTTLYFKDGGRREVSFDYNKNGVLQNINVSVFNADNSLRDTNQEIPYSELRTGQNERH